MALKAVLQHPLFFVLKMRYVAQNGSRIVHVGHHLFQCLEHGFFVFGQRAATG